MLAPSSETVRRPSSTADLILSRTDSLLVRDASFYTSPGDQHTHLSPSGGSIGRRQVAVALTRRRSRPRLRPAGRRPLYLPHPAANAPCRRRREPARKRGSATGAAA